MAVQRLADGAAALGRLGTNVLAARGDEPAAVRAGARRCRRSRPVARLRHSGGPAASEGADVNVLDEFTTTVSKALGIDAAAVDRDLVLDLTKDVAHNVARPAAPLAAFLVGLAAGKAGGSRDDIRAAAEKVAALANGYTAPDGE